MEISKDLMKDIVKALIKSGCLFFHCDGYETEPVDMITCHRCYALHGIFKEHPELKEEAG